jgi:2-oxoglutarate ferredoxin oxidoreductase subunit alpha
MRGNHVIGEAAVRAGCRFYAGYPITPQNELTEYMAARLSEVDDGVFIQAESELAAINMVMGASMAGVRAMTSSSSPGISLKQEGISFLAAMELPSVIVNVSRGGPGLGNIAPSQSDYFQTTRGGGHGDYRNIALAPSSVQELADLTIKAFDLADHYRIPAFILADGMLGQMMEPVEFQNSKKPTRRSNQDWTLTGAKGRPSRIVRSLLLDPVVEEEHNWKLVRKHESIEKNEILYETFLLEDALLAVVAFGTAARIAKAAVIRARERHMKVGMFRPITVWPFPYGAIQELSRGIKHYVVFELNTGQMVEDIRLGLEGEGGVHFYGRPGGIMPTPLEVSRVIASQYIQNRLE